MSLDRRANGGPLSLAEPDAAVQVVNGHHEDQGEDAEVEQPGEDVVPQRESEHEEGDVGIELGVGDPERGRIEKQEDVVPPGGDADAEQQREGAGDGESHQTQSRLDPVAKSLDEFLVLSEVQQLVARRDAVGDPQVEPDDAEHHECADDGEHDGREQVHLPDLGEVDGAEPQKVRPHRRQAGEHQVHDGHDDGDDRETPPPIHAPKSR